MAAWLGRTKAAAPFSCLFALSALCSYVLGDGAGLTMPMRVETWDHIEVWRPYVREAAQAVLDEGAVPDGTSVEKIYERRTRLAQAVVYEVEVAFGASPDGSKPAFNASARVFDEAFEWNSITGSTLHTELWLRQQREQREAQEAASVALGQGRRHARRSGGGGAEEDRNATLRLLSGEAPDTPLEKQPAATTPRSAGVDQGADSGAATSRQPPPPPPAPQPSALHPKEVMSAMRLTARGPQTFALSTPHEATALASLVAGAAGSEPGDGAVEQLELADAGVEGERFCRLSGAFLSVERAAPYPAPLPPARWDEISHPARPATGRRLCGRSSLLTLSRLCALRTVRRTGSHAVERAAAEPGRAAAARDRAALPLAPAAGLSAAGGWAAPARLVRRRGCPQAAWRPQDAQLQAHEKRPAVTAARRGAGA
jgi:hypothetical protein